MGSVIRSLRPGSILKEGSSFQCVHRSGDGTKLNFAAYYLVSTTAVRPKLGIHSYIHLLT